MKTKMTLPKGLIDELCKQCNLTKLGGVSPARFLPNLRYAKEMEES